jgi:hypothetical protein
LLLQKGIRVRVEFFFAPYAAKIIILAAKQNVTLDRSRNDSHSADWILNDGLSRRGGAFMGTARISVFFHFNVPIYPKVP